MTASIEISESNGELEVVTDGIANANMGDADAAELDPVSYPVTPGENTYEKWQRLHVASMGGSSKILNLRVWRSSALGGSALHKTNARIAAYGGAETYVEPVKTDSSIATQAMPTAEPATANLGIGGALAGSLTATGYSDYLVHQIQTDAGDVAGSTSTMHFEYDEVA